MLPRIVKKAVQKHWGGKSFDFILFEAPPVTLQSVIRWAKKKFNCPAYLMQKDIFPQNAVDLKFFGKKSLAYAYFRSRKKKMLKASDFIGCMSQANIDYIRKHNPYLNPKQVEYFPNTKSVKPQKEENKAEIRKEYYIPQNACVFLFGGNMGKPQNVGIICKAMDCFKGDNSVFFLFIGSGTNAGILKNHIKRRLHRKRAFLGLYAMRVIDSTQIGQTEKRQMFGYFIAWFKEFIFAFHMADILFFFAIFKKIHKKRHLFFY